MAFEAPHKYKEISGTQYKVVCLDARTCARLQQTLARVAGRAALSGASPQQQIAAALSSPIDLPDEIYDVLLSTAWADGKALGETWPEHFRGRALDLINLVLFALETNLRGFTDGLPRLLEQYVPAPTAEPTNEPG